MIPAIVFHEVSHGYVALLCGDTTARDAKRLTLNPLRHVDPFGTVLLPALLAFSGAPVFGYAKPVPVNVSRLRHPRRDSLYVSLAGPLTNLALLGLTYVVGRVALNTFLHGDPLDVSLNSPYGVVINAHLNWLIQACYDFGLVNLLLAAFNLIPIPPLDGSAIIERFIPQRNLAGYYQFRRYALPIVMLLIFANAVAFHSDLGFGRLQNWWFDRLI
ncbi:MAG: site-2 protease family protein [Acidimicrobiales bacterium]